MEYAHKVSNVIPGREYLVAHARVKYPSGAIYSIPVIPHKHNDPAFGAQLNHYHIDGRFIKNGTELAINFRVHNGKTGIVIFVPKNEEEAKALRFDYYNLEGIQFIQTKCIRKESSLLVPHNIDHPYWVWYKSMFGKSCAGKKCPHYGTQMIEYKGRLFCPLHNLEADPETELVILPKHLYLT